MPAMKRLNIMGWRGINHSYALVNQFQILSLRKNKEIEIVHSDRPFASPAWNENSNSSGLLADDVAWLKSIPQGENDGTFDWRYQIYSPNEYLPPVGNEACLVFLVTELGIDPSDEQTGKLRFAANSGELKIVTPSQWSKSCLMKSGFDDRAIKIVPHAASLDYFHAIDSDEIKSSRQNLSISDSDIVLLNVSSPFWNKGCDVLITGFARALEKNKNLLLIIKDQKNLYNLDSQQAIHQSLKDHNIDPAPVLGRVKVIQDNLNLQQLRTLYNISDWYVSPYRAEGFNLPVCEALVCGTPAIVTEGGATEDFVSVNSGFKIQSTMMEQLDPNGKPIYYREPSEAHLIEILSSLKRHQSITPIIDSNFNSWDHAVQQLIRAFQA